MFAKYQVGPCTSAAGTDRAAWPFTALLYWACSLHSSPPGTVAEDASHTLGLVLQWTHTHKRTHTQSTHMSTCPQACKHTHTHTESRDNLAFCLSVLQSSPHSSVEHTVQRVSWHLGRYHSSYQPNNQLNVQERTVWWPRSRLVI